MKISKRRALNLSAPASDGKAALLFRMGSCFLRAGLAPLLLLSLPQLATAQGNVGYQEGLKAARAKNYVDAARFFYTVVVTGSGPDKAKAEFALADSLQKMNLNYSAAYFYSRIVAQGRKNDFFRPALEALGSLNARVPLGKASVAGILQGKVENLEIPPLARGFYFFYKGLDTYEKSGQTNQTAAKSEFALVPANSEYYGKAQYYIGVISGSTLKQPDEALGAFNRVLASIKGSKDSSSEKLKELVNLNIARVYYEKKDYRKALGNYSAIPRNSDNWLEALFESAWAFFMMQRHNNTLGNIHTIHSPFFSHRFYPETYILQAISYLKLCRIPEVKVSLKEFQDRYKPTFADLNSLLKKYQNQPAAFFSLINRYDAQNSLKEFQAASEIVDSISRSDSYKEAIVIVKNSDKERIALNRYGAKWDSTGLNDVLRKSLEKRKEATVAEAGTDLFAQAVRAFSYLKDLSDQTKLINLDALTTNSDQFRAVFRDEPVQNDGMQWGEGLRPLNLTQQLEYWPFEGEYWEDELGGYVYNVASKCKTAARAEKSGKK